MTPINFPICPFDLNDFLAPHLQTDIDAILDCYRKLRRRSQNEEARFVWMALDYVILPKKRRYSQAEKLIPFIDTNFDDYLYFIPKFAWGEHERFAKIPTIVQSNSQIKATLYRYFPTNKVTIQRSPRPNRQSLIHFRDEEDSLSLIKEILDKYVKYYGNLELNIPYIFKNVYYFPVIEKFHVSMGSRITPFWYPAKDHNLRD